jgi:TetR/AcrR family transcriptional regulator, repressor of fatR-cypB operon
VRTRDEAKESRILAGTLKLVEQQGLSGLSMEAVAKAAGVAIGTVYIYFDSKEALLNALYLRTKRELSGKLFEGAAEGEPIKPAFHRMCMAYLRYVAAHRAEMVFMHQFRNSPFIHEQTKELGEQTGAPMVRMLERAKKEGLIKDLPIPLMLAFLQGTLSELASYPAKGSRDELYQEFARLAWDALKA